MDDFPSAAAKSDTNPFDVLSLPQKVKHWIALSQMPCRYVCYINMFILIRWMNYNSIE